MELTSIEGFKGWSLGECLNGELGLWHRCHGSVVRAYEPNCPACLTLIPEKMLFLAELANAKIEAELGLVHEFATGWNAARAVTKQSG